MKAFLAAVLAVSVLPFALACSAQTPPPDPQPKTQKAKPPTGSLSGIAYCADTNLPARNAQIVLVPTSGENRGIPNATVTDLNGRFALGKVPEGRYDIEAMLPGYIDLLAQFSASRLAAMSAEERKEFDAQMTAVVISAGQPANVSLRLERGIEIDGTVTYDDGSPAISLQIASKRKTEKADVTDRQEESFSAFRQFFDQLNRTTDDRGRFRILGVPPGEYLVSVTVPGMSADPAGPTEFARLLESVQMESLVVYAGGSLRASTAKTIKVTAGGASSDADIIIPLSKLHSIHGDIVLKSTGQPPASAVLQLVYADTQEPARYAISTNGHFDLSFVPEESYLIRATAGAVALPNMDFDDAEEGVGVFASGIPLDTSPSLKQPGSAEIPLLVKGDVEGILIAVPDPPAANQPVLPQSPEQGSTATPPPQ
jgi:hypothetical protein